MDRGRAPNGIGHLMILFNFNYLGLFSNMCNEAWTDEEWDLHVCVVSVTLKKVEETRTTDTVTDVPRKPIPS